MFTMYRTTLRLYLYLNIISKPYKQDIFFKYIVILLKYKQIRLVFVFPIHKMSILIKSDYWDEIKVHPHLIGYTSISCTDVCEK